MPPAEAPRVDKRRFDVGIVGAGPTGLVIANLLGAEGFSVLVAEQHPGTSAEAKAISIDDEALRIMARADLGNHLKDVVVPGTGTRYYGRHGQLLFHARGVEPPHHGYPIKSPFAQPALEAALLDALDRFPNVTVEFQTKLTGFAQTAAGVEPTLVRDGAEEVVEVAYMLGCDGAHSTVREQLGISMRGSSFSQRWIVIDSLGDPHDERFGLHHGLPSRPHVVIPGKEGRCRYEFLLADGEVESEPVPHDFLESLLAEYRPIARDQIERIAVYRFHALLADHWQRGRAFLLGDAAHLMPPFAGQGLNAGIRDAGAIAWRLAMVLAGRGGMALLSSYEIERKPHARKTIDLSVRMGEVVMTTSRPRAVLRDAVIEAGLRLRPVRRYLEEMRFRPVQCYREGFVSSAGGRDELLGSSLPQPRVLDCDGAGVPLDARLGNGFALLAVEVADRDLALVDAEAAWDETFAAQRLRIELDRFPADGARWPRVADFDGALRRLFGKQAGKCLLVRPDRFVAAVFPPRLSCAVAADLRRRLDDTPSASGGADWPGPDTTNTTEVIA